MCLCEFVMVNVSYVVVGPDGGGGLAAVHGGAQEHVVYHGPHLYFQAHVQVGPGPYFLIMMILVSRARGWV